MIFLAPKHHILTTTTVIPQGLCEVLISPHVYNLSMAENKTIAFKNKNSNEYLQYE